MSERLASLPRIMQPVHGRAARQAGARARQTERAWERKVRSLAELSCERSLLGGHAKCDMGAAYEGTRLLDKWTVGKSETSFCVQCAGAAGWLRG